VVRAAEGSLLEEIRGIDANLLSSALQPECQLVKQPPGGEAQVVAAAGGRYVSIVGKGFPLFHSTEDRWPEAIDAQAIAHNANLVATLIERMDAEPA
jgi:hypothetical protein